MSDGNNLICLILKESRSLVVLLLLSKSAVEKIESDIDERVEDAIRQAKAAAFPDTSELYEGVFA